ncbi:hypothetical protein [Pseudidiomarina sediminum]|uniref:hypothetical protein n=1 Tax=Pseudidiomarina sediminum TaxID=431675 RepID=UPI001C9434D0|nr:hypothetical protein [Pseudidiomarina sediminum]MBY6062930.1 hypothetical protein [Pseudidiomarina sediminum]
MTATRLLHSANTAMVVFLVSFIIVGYFAWGMEAELPLMLVAVLHLGQIILAGLFKISYVVRLIAQHRLGRPLR